jgi:hypothetical protein
MNSERLQKTKILVQTSPILNKQEKDDWSNLLELMNDKQVMELESILSYKPAVSPLASPNSSAPVALSHIMNFPTHIPDKQTPPKAPALQEKPKDTRFSKWLKATVAEKELPKPPVEKALPAAPKPVKPDPIPVIQPLIIDPPIEKKPAAPPILPLANKPVLKPLLPEEKKPDVAQKQVVSLPEKKPIEKEKTRLPVDLAGAFMPKKLDTRQSGLINYPQNFSEASASLQNTQGVQQPALGEVKKTGSSQVSIPQAPKNNLHPQTEKTTPGSSLKLQISDLKEMGAIAGLTLDKYKKDGPDAFANILASGIKSFGYHKAIAALEVSSLYSSYIDTGLKLLSEGKSFEDLMLNDFSEPKKYLTRSDFEKFTDLLRQVPATVQSKQ